MDQPSYCIDVRGILDEHGGIVSVDAQVPVPAITLGTEKYDTVGPAHLVATLTNTGAGVVLWGEVQLVVIATCSRCLEPFELSVTGEVEGFYVHHGHERDLPEEQEFAFITEGSVDVMDPLLGAVALAIPFAPVHAEDCAGICVTCGADLSEGSCACAPDLSRSPFMALKDLLPPSGQESGQE